MYNWESTVRLASGYLKKINLTGYNTEQDASAAARGQTGGGEILLTQKVNAPSPMYVRHEPECHTVYEEVDDKYIDDLEEQMFMYHCERAIRLGKEPPTVEEFYDWLENRFN